jgi:hypothetical protein
MRSNHVAVAVRGVVGAAVDMDDSPAPCFDSEPQWRPHYPQGVDMRPIVTEPSDDVTALARLRLGEHTRAPRSGALRPKTRHSRLSVTLPGDPAGNADDSYDPAIKFQQPILFK